MPLTILIGPCSAADSRALAEALATHARVDCVDERDAFRRSVLAHRHDVIIICSMDRDGIPNEPLLRFCLARVPGQRVVSVLPGASARLADVDFDASANLSYYPLPVHPLPADFGRLAGFVVDLAGRRSGAGYAEA